jgi:DNA-directed RNA polymerase specialized sigma24 family protein
MPRRAKDIDRWGFPVRHAARIELLRPVRRKASPNRTRAGFRSNAKLLPALRRLCNEPREGRTLTHEQIATACGVSAGVILNLERSGLRKLRVKLPADLLKQLQESMRLL